MRRTGGPPPPHRCRTTSRSGSGAATAANLCAASVGTETDGSITSPSSANGLVGLKPTVGALSRDGIVPISFTQDTPGPMCRTVRDAALLFAAMAGVDARDAVTRASAKRLQVAALEKIDTRSLRGVRLGIASNLTSSNRGVAKLFDEAQAALKSLGAEIVDAPIPNNDKAAAGELEVLLCELKHSMAQYLNEFAPNLPHKNLGDLINYNQKHAASVLALFGQELFEQAQAKGTIRTAAYRKALNDGLRYARELGIDAVLRTKRLQALIAPTGEPAWLIDTVNGDIAGGASATSPPAVAGYPHVTVPMGLTGGLPVGLSFIGPAWSDVRLLQFAHAYEQATKLRQPPSYKASVQR